MNRFFILLSGIAIFPLFAKDLLLDDCNSGTAQNNLGLYWYYFSDINDMGTSIIQNANVNSDGSYSRIVKNQHTRSDDLAATIEFTLGNKFPCDYRSGPCDGFDAFVGIGTDIAYQDTTVDLSKVTAISFDASGSADLEIFFELVTSDCTDRGYLRYVFTVTPEWQRDTIQFRDLSQETWTKELIFEKSIKLVYKLNWQITANGDNNHKSGTFQIDNVVLHGIDYLPGLITTSNKTISTVPAPAFTSRDLHFYNLLGKTISAGEAIKMNSLILGTSPSKILVQVSPGGYVKTQICP